MNVNSGGPHILLFERDQQLTALLSGELTLAGYEVHTARTAVEVFDAIARFPVRLVMVNLAQAQASRREFWVALDAQRRGRGVQVFTFRCTNVGGYGPDDPDERIDTVVTDLEVDGMLGIVRLVDAVRAQVPGPVTITSAPPRTAPAPIAGIQEEFYGQNSGRFIEMPQPYQVSPAYPPQMYSPASMAAMPPAPMTSNSQHMQAMPPAPMMSNSQHMQAMPPAPLTTNSQPMQAMPPASMMSNSQHMQATLHPLPQELPPPTPPARTPEPPRSGLSTFTDKIRAVIYPSSRSFSPAPEAGGPPRNFAPQAQNLAQYQNQDVQPHPQVSQRFAEADYSPAQINREEIMYQPAFNPQAPVQGYPTYTNTPPVAGARLANGESGLDQLSRMLRENQLVPQNAMINGNTQNTSFQPGLNVDQQEIQDMRSQVMQAARIDEAYERSGVPQSRSADPSGMGSQLRASPIQDLPFEREMAGRMRAAGESLTQSPENFARQAMTALQPTQVVSPAHPVSPPETPASAASSSQIKPLSPVYEASPQGVPLAGQTSSPLGMDGGAVQPDQGQTGVQQSVGRRPPEVRTSDDMLLDIVKSLPPMSPAPQPPQPQPPVLNGRATRSLGSVLLEGHLVPQERLQVAQHVQRMLRGVDLNYQLGEILLMFKLLTPDQLLAASLVSYGMISTMQISALGRIRQELYAMGLEYDLESLLVLFRILTPEQLREVRASWSS